MFITLSIALLRRFQCFHCLTKTVICLNPLVIFISILFRILYSLNLIHLPLFMLIKLSMPVSMLSLSNNAYNVLKFLGYLHINII